MDRVARGVPERRSRPGVTSTATGSPVGETVRSHRIRASNKSLIGSRDRCQFARQPSLFGLVLRPGVKCDQRDDDGGSSYTHEVPGPVESVETRVLRHRGVAHVVEPGRTDHRVVGLVRTATRQRLARRRPCTWRHRWGCDVAKHSSASRRASSVLMRHNATCSPSLAPRSDDITGLTMRQPGDQRRRCPPKGDRQSGRSASPRRFGRSWARG